MNYISNACPHFLLIKIRVITLGYKKEKEIYFKCTDEKWEEVYRRKLADSPLMKLNNNNPCESKLCCDITYIQKRMFYK